MPHGHTPGQRATDIGLIGAVIASLLLAAALATQPYTVTGNVLMTLGALWLLAISTILLLYGVTRTAKHLAAMRTSLEGALTDPVTGLPVRQVAEHAIARTDPSVAVTVALADVDRLHEVNNGPGGHSAGDLYLAEVAARLRQAANATDTVARLGGDEFVLISRREPTQVAASLTAALRPWATVAGVNRPIEVSIGICQLPGGDPHQLLGCADLAMFTAKRRGSGIEHYDAARDGRPLPDGTRPGIRQRDRRPASDQARSGYLPAGLLVCPQCGTTELATIERIPGVCRGEVTRRDNGDIEIDCGGQTDVDWDGQTSVGVQCERCSWSYIGTDWAAHLINGASGDRVAAEER